MFSKSILVLVLAIFAFPLNQATAGHLGGGTGHGGGSKDSTTLGDLSCSVDEVAIFDGSQWVCGSIPSQKRVFLSSLAAFNGNLGGVVGDPFITDARGGAHWLCNLLANNAGLPGTYKAWLSDDQRSPASDFVRSKIPYVTVDGTPIAQDYDDLTSGVLANPISVNELGEQVTIAFDVWTGTTTGGSGTGDSCSNWLDGGIDKIGGIGNASSTTSTWTDNGVLACDQNLRLYCFEQ